MPITMTQAEYDAKYGKGTAEPVVMTQAEYDAKYTTPSPETTQLEQKGIFSTIAPHFMRGLERTAEDAPKVLRNIAGGMVSGLADIPKTIEAVPSPLDLIGVTEKLPPAKIFDRLTKLGEDIAVDPTSPEFLTGQFFSPIPPLGKGGKVIKTAYGKAISKLPFDARQKAVRALDKLDEIGMGKLNVKARGKLMDELNIPASQEAVEAISKQAHITLSSKSKAAYKTSQDAYTQADKIAKQTNVFDTKNTIDVLSSNIDGRGGVPSKAFKKKRKAYEEIKSILKQDSTATAKGIEDKLKVLKEDQRAAKSNVSYLYERAIGSLEQQQKTLLKKTGNESVYEEARGLWKDWKKNFKGEIEGFGQTGGKSIDSVMKSKDNFNVSEDLLGGRMDANLAEQVGKNFTQQEKKDMVFSVLAKGIDDVNGLNTPENVVKLINNFQAADPKGMRLMLGAKGYAESRKSVDALSFVEAAIRAADKESVDIGQDILEMGAALAASKISPYAAVHVSINKAKNIINKKAFGTMKNQLIARTKKIKDKKIRNQFLKAIRTMQPISVGTQGLMEDTVDTEEE